ncbi:MAG TPA: squalene/phytoene synthase family protein [Parvularculaceae bacterium]|nr:squalene/phytoene synthase family protein [Parvularculaceae bacterium]
MTAATIDMGAARRHAEETVKRSGTSFGAGMAILPKKRREAMYAIYAFCREVDDIADDDGMTREERRRGLAEWREEIARLYDGRPEFPTGVALLEPVRAFDLPRNEFLMMIEGMEMDADGPIVAPSMETLLAYTRRVAGAVGQLSMPVFGASKGAASDRFALSLGDALQLTNILRDVAEDARIGRLYLPAELLEKYGAPTTAESVLACIAPHPKSDEPISASPQGGGEDGDQPLPCGDVETAEQFRVGVNNVAQDLGAMAREKFAEARAALKELDWRTVRPALLMMGVYEAYLDRMEKRGWDRIGEPVSLSRIEKLMIAARYWLAPPQ